MKEVNRVNSKAQLIYLAVLLCVLVFFLTAFVRLPLGMSDGGTL